MHVFYLEDRASPFLKGRLVPLVQQALKDSGKPIPPDIDEPDLLDYATDSLGINLSALLQRSTDPTFHASELVAMEASDFAMKTNNLILIGDDPAYGITTEVEQVLFIRLENEQTRMPGEVKWIDIDHVFCTACGVVP